ncbi:MAG: hypothetical protein ACU84Q_01390 [Gammaproteobacteria bacterium]
MLANKLVEAGRDWSRLPVRQPQSFKLSDYSDTFHHHSSVAFIETLDLKNMTLVCGDSGGILGLTLPLDMPYRFKCLIVMNTALPAGEGGLSEDFLKWHEFLRILEEVSVPSVAGCYCP